MAIFEEAFRKGVTLSRTLADEIVETLAQVGVQRIFGLVGDSLNPVTDALHRSGKLEWIHVRHEETAAFAAGAEAQLTGNLAVCAGSCGPGNLHLINGLFDAHRSMAPVLAIASHIPTSGIGLFGVRVEDPAEFRPALEQALAHPGPALVDVVTDPNVLAMPPRATVGQTAGFALAMTKLAFTGRMDDAMDTVAASWRELL